MYQARQFGERLTEKELLADVNGTPSGSRIFSCSKGYLIINKDKNNGWTFVSFLAYSNIYKKVSGILCLYFFFTFIILVLSILVILPTIHRITRPLVELADAMGKVSDGNLNSTLRVSTDDEVGQLAIIFNKMLCDMKNYIHQTVNYEKEKRNIELNLLVAQINPHFIYNTLNTVIYMASKEKANDIVDMVKSFIAVLHDAVKINGDILLTEISLELHVLRQYLNIQKYRYQNRFQVVWDIDESLLSCKIPRTILQPVVENSLLHGILPSERDGVIKISVLNRGGDIALVVEDNGVGMDGEAISRILAGNGTEKAEGGMRSIGVYNVSERIKYICGESYGIRIESEKEKYTRFTIIVPKIP